MAVSAIDELTYGPARTLDLHRASPTAGEAARRAEAWLRERQVAGAREVLVITGRGRRSLGGVAVLRPAVERLLARLRRAGVVSRVRAHGEGAFVVTLAPVRALFEAPPRTRDRAAPVRIDDRAFAGLSGASRAALQALALRALEHLGAPTTPAFVEDEMRRQFALLAPGLPAGPAREDALARVAREAADSLEA